MTQLFNATALDGETALVTGASRGIGASIGAALAAACAARGDQVTGLSRSRDGLDLVDDASVARVLGGAAPEHWVNPW